MKLFKRRMFIKIIYVFICIHLCTNGFSQQSKDSGGKALRVLLIGNSFSQNATSYLPQLAQEGGHQLVFGHAEIGSCSLQKHWELAELNRQYPDSNKGKPYSGKSLQMLLSEPWDVVTIQQYSLLSSHVETYMPYARYLFNLVKRYQPNARIFLHQTWAYRSDATSFGEVAKGVMAKTEAEMYERSRVAYHTIANDLKIGLLPTGDAFWLMSTDKKWSFKRDDDFDTANIVEPLLPQQKNSLNVGYSWVKGKLAFDSHHANDAGKYLGGLVWYQVLFGESTLKMNFKPETVSEKFAKQLRKAAAKAVEKNK